MHTARIFSKVLVVHNLMAYAVAICLWAWHQSAVADTGPSGLRELLAVVVSEHPQVLVRQAQLRGAQSSVREAFWQYFPTPAISYSRFDKTNVFGNRDSAVLSLKQPIWAGGGLDAGYAIATSNERNASSELLAVRDQVAMQVVSTYGDWLKFMGRVEAAEYSKNALRGLRGLIDRRVKFGVSARVDGELVRARLAQADTELEAARNGVEVAVVRLRELVGREVLPLAVTAPISNLPSSSSILNEALSRSPVLSGLTAQVEKAEATVDQKRAMLSPQIYLQVEQQLKDYSIDALNRESRAQIIVQSNFGPGFASISGIEGARAAVEAARSSVASYKREITQSIYSEYSLLVSAQARAEFQRNNANATADVYESYKRQFVAGKRGWMDLLNIVRELATAKAAQTDAEAEEISSSWRLAILARGPMFSFESTVQ